MLKAAGILYRAGRRVLLLRRTGKRRSAICPELDPDLAPRRIRVNVLVPGPTATPGLLGLASTEEQKHAFVTMFEGLVPLGRLGTANESANAALFLASDESSFVNGSELFIDGGEAQV